MKQENQIARSNAQTFDLQKESFGPAPAESRRSFLGSIAKAAGAALGAVALTGALGREAQARDRIVQSTMTLEKGEPYAWTCEGLRKVFVENKGKGGLDIKVTMHEGYGDPERVVMRRHLAPGKTNKYLKDDGTGREYTVEITARKKTRAYIHIETH